MKTSELKSKAKNEMNKEFKSLSQALKVFKDLSKKGAFGDYSEAISGCRVSALDLRPNQIILHTKYLLCNGEIVVGAARKTKNGFKAKINWTINDIFEAFSRIHGARFKQERIQVSDLID